MQNDIRTYPKEFDEALELVLEYYWKDERRDFCSKPNHERSLNHIYHSLRTIRRVLRRSPQPINVHAVLASRRQIAIVWSIDDVLSVRPHLTEEQAWDVLGYCERKHDCCYGFTWDLLESVADDMYPASS